MLQEVDAKDERYEKDEKRDNKKEAKEAKEEDDDISQPIRHPQMKRSEYYQTDRITSVTYFYCCYRCCVNCCIYMYYYAVHRRYYILSLVFIAFLIYLCVKLVQYAEPILAGTYANITKATIHYPTVRPIHAALYDE